MWSRSDLKASAKLSIKKNIWMCIGITFIVSILGGTTGNSAKVTLNTSSIHPEVSIGFANIPVIAFVITAWLVLVAIIIGVIYNIFILEPLKVGHYRFYLENREENSHFNALLYVFKCGSYWNVVKICFLKNLYTFLWTLLLIIPGIYKAYEYQMIPFILAENPALPAARVFELTKEMTYHKKFDMFILDLSFTGWILLTFFTCGLGMIFLNPYIHATATELYIYLRDEQLDCQYASYEDFPGFAEVMVYDSKSF